jgi:site-specific DNA recombinase
MSTARIRAIGYVRVSTDEQVQGFSLDAQAERIRTYALSQDCSLVHIHRDDGYSAKDLNRPGTRLLLADVKAGRVEVILVYKLDRLSRRLRDLTEILDLVAEHGAKFESVTEPFTLSASATTSTGSTQASARSFWRPWFRRSRSKGRPEPA